MRKVLIVLVVVAAIPVALFLKWDTQTRTLGNALLADLTAAKQRIIRRDPPPKEPRHDDGFKCLGGMLDVTSPAFVATFSGKNVEALEPFITGSKPIAELAPEVRANMVSASAWAGSMRECSQSMQVSWVEGLAPWSTTGPRPVRLAEAMPALIDFTALELRVLLADGQPEVALERCSTTWALAADQSHLGAAGAKTTRTSVKRLTAGCSAALNALPAAATPVKENFERQLIAVRKRLAPASEIVEAERLREALRTFAWVSDEAIRQQLPGVVMPPSAGLLARVEAGRTWLTWDAAMRKLSAAADAGGPDRQSASAVVDALIPSNYDAVLSDYAQTADELDALAEVASEPAAKPAP